MPDICSFCCATEDLAECRYPALVFEVARYREVKVGDRLRRYVDKEGKKPPVTVREIEGSVYGFRLMITATWRTKSGCQRTMSIAAAPHSRVRVERPGICQTRCCPLHRCERSENTIYCQDHWRLPEIAGGTPAPLPLPDPLRSRTALRAEQQIMKSAGR